MKTGSKRKAPSGRELPTESGEGERVEKSLCKLKVTRAPSTTSWSPFLPEEGFCAHSSVDSGFGLLPGRAWTTTRYACPRCGRRESGNIVNIFNCQLNRVSCLYLVRISFLMYNIVRNTGASILKTR